MTTYLQTKAALTAPGGWTLYNQEGDGSNYGTPIWPDMAGHGGEKIYDFSCKAADDPEGRRIFFRGHGHIQEYPTTATIDQIEGQIVYDKVNNLWNKIPIDDYIRTIGGNGHSYGLQDICPKTREYLYSIANTNHIRKLNIDAATGSFTGTSFTDLAIEPPLSPNTSSGAICYFPERNARYFLENAGGSLWEQSMNPGSPWTLKFTSLTDLAGLGVGMFYSSFHKIMVFGGGVPNNAFTHKYYMMDATGTVTAIQDSPAAAKVYFAGWSLGWFDPVNGDFLVLTSDDPGANGTPIRWEFYRWRFAINTWDRLDGTGGAPSYEGNIPQILGIQVQSSNKFSVFDCVCVPLAKEGVTLFIGQKVYLYKHVDSTWPVGQDHTAKVNASAGARSGLPFDSQTELKYSWDTNNPVINSVMVARGETNYSVGNGGGNVITFGLQNSPFGDVPLYGVIDHAVTYNGGAGSLRFDVPQGSGASQSAYQGNIDGGVGTVSNSHYVSPVSIWGPILYVQFAMQVNATQLNTVYQQVSGVISTLSVTTPGSLHIFSNAAFLNSFAGKRIYISQANGGMVTGVYTLVTFVSVNEMILDRTAAPSAAGSGSGGIETSGNFVSGFKVVINYGNNPFGASSGGLEITMNVHNFNQSLVGGDSTHKPQFYGQSGGVSAPPNTTIPLIAGQWQEHTYRIEVRGTLYGNLSTPAANSTTVNNDGSLAPFTSAVNGVALYISGGNFITGVYLATYVSPSQITLDRAPSTSAPGSGAKAITTNTPTGRVTWWVDSVKAGDWPTATMNWGGADGDGIGQVQITPYNTNADSFQAKATGKMYIDDVVFSTEPIAFGASVASNVLSIITTSLNAGSTGTPYSRQISATGGTAPYTFALTVGTLPTGITLSAGGLLSGTPTQSGTFNITVRVTDNVAATATRDLSLVVNLSTNSVLGYVSGSVNGAYSPNYLISCGPFTMPENGQASSMELYVPDEAGNVTMGIRADAVGVPGASLMSTVGGLLPSTGIVGWKRQNLTGTLSLTVGSQYWLDVYSDQTLQSIDYTANSGRGRFTPAAYTDGVMPAVYNQAGSQVLNQDFDIRVNYAPSPGGGAPTITTTSPLPSGTVGLAYSQQLVATGGTTPYTWSVSVGTLPSGLTLSSSGLISGTPGALSPGTVSITVKVTDSVNQSATQVLSITITTNPLAITVPATSTLPGGVRNVVYTLFTMTATGGTGPYTWITSTGAFPNGLSMSSGGVLTGTPTQIGVFDVTIKATDSVGLFQTKALQVNILNKKNVRPFLRKP